MCFLLHSRETECFNGTNLQTIVQLMAFVFFFLFFSPYITLFSWEILSEGILYQALNITE